MEISGRWARPLEQIGGLMVLAGLGCIVGAAWAVRPVLGVAVLGVILVVLGKGFSMMADRVRATFPPPKAAPTKATGNGFVAESSRVRAHR